jgi:hypothetical protein
LAASAYQYQLSWTTFSLQLLPNSINKYVMDRNNYTTVIEEANLAWNYLCGKLSYSKHFMGKDYRSKSSN